MANDKPRITNPTAELKKKLDNFPKKGIFSAFVTQPQNVKFETQEAEETPLLILRKHIITNIPWLIVSFLLIIAPLFYPLFPIFNFLPIRYLPIILLGWYLLIVAYIFENFLVWFYNIYIVTDERIIDVDFYNILYKQISDAKIDKIQDVTYDQKGIFQAFFNYGSIMIQTAAEQNEFVFESVPNPDKVVSVINLLIAEEEQEAIEGRIR